MWGWDHGNLQFVTGLLEVQVAQTSGLGARMSIALCNRALRLTGNGTIWSKVKEGPYQDWIVEYLVSVFRKLENRLLRKKKKKERKQNTQKFQLLGP